jgi:hypothetical protein
MILRNEREERTPDTGYNQEIDLGNLDDVTVNGERFAFEGVVVTRFYRDNESQYPESIRAEWSDVQLVTGDDVLSFFFIPTCYINSAPIMNDTRQPAGVSWGDLMERALIDMAEKKGGWR